MDPVVSESMRLFRCMPVQSNCDEILATSGLTTPGYKKSRRKASQSLDLAKPENRTER
jgi:hypothetical protein